MTRGHSGDVYHLIVKSFRDWGKGLYKSGIFNPSQWIEVATIKPENLFREGSTLTPSAHPLYLLAREEGIDLVKEPLRGERKIFWAVEGVQGLFTVANSVMTGHRQRIAVNYVDGQPHSVEAWIYREAEKDWRPAFFKFENGIPVPNPTFLGKAVEEKCIQCHFNQGHPREFPKSNPIPFAMWGGAYGEPSRNGWHTERFGVKIGLDPSYTPARATRNPDGPRAQGLTR